LKFKTGNQVHTATSPPPSSHLPRSSRASRAHFLINTNTLCLMGKTPINQSINQSPLGWIF